VRTAALILMLVSACGPTVVDWDKISQQKRQVTLNKIIELCGLDSRIVQLLPDGAVAFEPKIDADNASVECALDAFKKLKGLRLGFFGNEVDGNAK
jgi:hypothetical protein